MPPPKPLCLELRYPNESYSSCHSCCFSYFDDHIKEDERNMPMPWIGLYIAGASLICSLAMAADLFLGFRNKKLWLPCKFFTLNAASLTLLAVAMKLPVDLSTDMPGDVDQLAKITSSVFICMAIGNFMPSLGQMNNKEIITNVVALGILVVTIFVNLRIQLTTRIFFPLIYVVPMFVMLVLLVIVSSSAIYVPSTRKHIDLRYGEIHKTYSIEESDEVRKFNVDKLRASVRKYWIMAETGSPQFLMARSVTCVASEAFCVMIAVAVLFLDIVIYTNDGFVVFENTSIYKWSPFVIHVIQTIGVVVGTITCAVRLFTTIILKCSGLSCKSIKTEFRTENFWIERLVEWKKKPLPLKIRSQKRKRLVHNSKNLFLCFCIWIQNMIVVVSKLIQLIFVFLIVPLFLCYHYCKQLKWKLIPNSSSSSNHSSSGLTTATKIDVTRYVLRLEGENELPERILNNISYALDRLIQKGKKQQPKNLKELLKKSIGFKGVAEFDNDRVPSLVSYEPPNSWMMPVVTLTSIAIALPNITDRMVEGLISRASEGLVYINLIEKELDGKGDLTNIINTTEGMWLEVELSRKWLDQDLRKMASKESNSEGTLKSLVDIAATSIVEFKKKANKIQMENPLEWPVMAIAANFMHRISQTLLLDYELGNEKTCGELFEKLFVMIADIVVACLTNLPRVITMKCFRSLAEKREESVRQAAHLLGETEEILKILQQRELPSLNQDQAVHIDYWRAMIKQDNLAFISSSNHDTASSGRGDIHIAVEQDAC